MGNQGSIEFQVNLGLNTAEGQVNKLRELLKDAVNVRSSAFNGLTSALDKAEKQVADLKSKMQTAFQTAGGSKKFLAEYTKLFESLDSIGNRFSFLKEADVIFSPESSEELKSMRAEVAALEDSIKQIKSGKVGKLFEDDSVDSIKQVREAADMVKVTLSNVTFQDFKQKVGAAMTETSQKIEETTKQINLLKEAAGSAQMKKDTIFSQLNMERLMESSTEVLKSEGASTFREKIKQLYNEFGLNDIDLSKTVRAGTGLDQMFLTEQERIKGSTDKFVTKLEEEKQRVQEALDNFSNIYKNTADGKRANWQSKLAYTDEIRKQFEGLISFTEASPELRSTGKDIKSFVDNFEKELREGLANLSTADIARVLQLKLQEIFQTADAKVVITDLKDFQSEIQIQFGQIFKGIDLGDLTAGITKGWSFDKAIDQVLLNLQASIEKIDPSELQQKLEQYKAALETLKGTSETLNRTEAQENGSLKEKEAAWQTLTDKILTYIQARLNAVSAEARGIGENDAPKINQTKTAIEQYIESLNKLEGKQKTLSGIQSAVTRWMGFYQVLNLTKRAINDMKQHIQELDTVMTQIAVVTNMSQEQLWGQIGKYSEIARSFGVAIKGVYEVSQIYYQQGLESNDVMTLTTETLKMARIAGLDYATAADYMTTAIRGFKLEMTDAAHVTDVFSALAASTASSTEELAVAISKTAASAANVGSSFEATSAMMATMIATTRESATNIGTALKSIISRYGEMTSKPNATTDSEGEEMSLNRVDKALQTIGITLHTTTGEFRNFDEVILELAEKWDTLDSVSQRYIATIMAGNRQQSRFLALVSNVDEYKRALEVAEGSEGSGELQMLKTLDSVDAKLEKMRVTIQEFYTSSGLEQLYKNIIDAITNIISAANDMPKMFKNIPVQAIAVGTALISAIKGFLMLIVNEISMALEQAKGQTTSILDSTITIAIEKGQEAGIGYGNSFMKAMSGAMQGLGTSTGQLLLKNLGPILSIIGSGFTISGLSKYGASTSADQDRDAGQTTGTGAVLGILGSTVSGAALGAAKGSAGGIPGALVGGAIGAITGIVKNFGTLATAWQQYNVTLGRQIELSEKAQQQAKQKLQQDQSEQKNLEQAVVKLQQLKEARYDSIEAEEEYRDYMNQLSETYPQLVDHMEQGGNAIIEVTALEDKLAAARLATANSTVQALKKEKDTLENYEEARENFKTQTSAEIIDNEAKILLGRQIKGERSYSWDMSQEEAIVREYLEDHGQDSYEFLGDEQSQQATEKSQSYFTTYQNEIFKWAKEKGYFSRDNLFNKQHQGNLVDYIWSALDKYNTAMPDDKILEYFDVKSKADLEKLNFEDLYNLSQKISRFAVNLYNDTKEAITAVDESLVNAEINEGVQNRLNQLRDNPETKNNADKLQKYASLMSFIYSGMGNMLPEDDKMQELENYLLNNPIEADKLLSLDYSQYRTIGDLSFIPKVYRKAFEDAFTKTRTAATEGLEQQTEELQLSDLDSLFDDNIETNGELINALIPNLRDSLAKYRSLLDNKNVASAENYRKNMVDFYTKIAELSTYQQQQILSLVPDIDFTDSASLRSAAETIRALGPDYEAVAQNLENAANRWVGNAQLILAQVLETASDTAKAIENAFDNQGKTFKRSEVLKNASELLASYTGTDKENLDWSDLYEYSEAAGGYIETQKAFEIRLANATSEATKNIQEAERAIGFEETTSKKLTPTVLNILQRDRNKALADDKTYKDIYGNTVGLQGENLDAAWAQFETISKAWEDLDDTTRASYADFAAYYQEKLEKDQEELEKARKEIADMPKEMAQQYLKNDIDYKAIAGGTVGAGTEKSLRSILEKAGGFKFDQSEWTEIWAALIAGDFKKYNTLLANMGHADLGVSDNTGIEMIRAEYTQYSNALDEIIAKKPYNALSQTTQQLVGTQADYDGANVVSAAYSYVARIQELFNQGQASIEEVNAAIVKAMNFEDAENGIGKQKKALDAAKDGFTNEELVDLGLVEEIKNEAGEIIGYGLKADAQAYLEKDVLNGGWKTKGSQSMKDVVLALNEAFGLGIDTTSKEWQDFIKSDLQQQISDLDAADTAKQRTAAYASLAGAKVGDRLDVSALSESVQNTLRDAGLDITEAGLLTVTSEEALNNGILALKEKLTKGHWAERHPLEASQIDSMVRDLEGRMNRLSGLSGIIGESVSHSAAQSFALAFEGTTERASEIMERMGAVWDDLSQTWIIDEDDLGEIESYIQELEAQDTTGANATAISQMRAQVENLRDSFARRPAQALNDVLTNYTNVSNDMIATFDQYWLDKVDISEYIISIDEVTGNKKIDIVGLKQALIDAGEDVEELFNEVIAQVTDELLGQLSTGVNFQISGTNNFTEMQNFVDNINEKLESDFTIKDLFSYNTALDSFTLNTTAFNNYKKALEKELQDLHWSQDLIDEYIKDQTDVVIQQNIELDSFLNANTSKQRNDEANKLIYQIRGLSNYKDLFIQDSSLIQKLQEHHFEQDSFGRDWEKYQEQYDLLILETLESGGQAAVDLLKQIKPDASQEELEAAFNSQINKLNDVMSQVGDLVVGQFIGTEGKLYEVLSRAKAVDDNGVVKAGFNMVEVYAAIYAEMTKTAGETTAGLNDAYAKLLTAQDQTNIDITEALKNGNGMSYADFGDLLAKYDIKFEEYMAEHWDTVMRDGFGNIRITDWEGFAKNVFKTDNLDAIRNTDEYIGAFKAYNDGLIELNKNTEQAITDEIKQIENAKAGDWLNFSELWTKLQDTTSKAIENVYINGYNGNVELGNRKIVSPETMSQAFPWAEFTSQDYATIFGQTFTAQDLLENSVFQQTKENIGLVFAQIDEAGQAVTDVAEYATSLLGSTLDSEGHIDIDTLLEYDQKARNLILDVRKYASTMTNDQVWETEDALAQVIHEREEQASNMRHWQIQLEAYGASLEDGILKLGDNANLIGIADTLSQMAEGVGLEIGNGLEEVQDAVLNVLTSIREIISQGIEGGLTGEQVQTLETRAQELGLSNIDFTETKEGFKLTTESAKELYFALNDLNGFQGEALFEDLSESLIETDSHFKTVQDTLTYINQLSVEIQTLRNEEDPIKNQARIASLENELALAEKINMTRSIDTEDDSFKFMEGKIPEAQNNPLNYWNNWAKAFDAMKTAGKQKGKAKNTIGYQDFYNIVSEMGRLAELSGKAVTLGEHVVSNSETAANLITEAASALKNVDGEMKIDLSKINIDFSSGLQDLGQQVDEQVDALATEQIAMLDSIIAVLEIIVAMEALEDVDANKDMHLDFSELGITVDGADNITAVNDNLAGVVAQLSSLDATLEDGTSILDAVSIDTGKAQVSFREFLTNWQNLTWLSENGITGTTFSQLFNNLYTMAKSDAYNDKEMTVQSIVDLFQSLDWGDLAISVNSGNHTLTLNDSGMYSLNWETMNYDNYRNIFEQEIPEKKRSTDEEIKKKVKAAYESEVNSSEGLTVETNTEIKVLQNKVVKIEEGEHKGEYKAGNQYFDSLEQAVAASDLFDIGAKNIKVQGEGQTATAEGEIVIGNYHMKVTSQQAGAKFEADDGTEFDSKQAAFDYMFNRDMETSGTVNHESVEYQEWEIEQGIRLTPVYKITDEDGNSYSSDLNKNPEMRAALKDFITNIDKDKVTLSKDGKSITVEFAPGMEITMPAEGIQFGDDFSEEALKSALTEQLGIDEALKDTISSAIKEAFKGLKDGIDDLDSKPLTEIADAISTIVTAIDDLSKNKGIETLNEELGKLDTKTLEAIGAAFETISNNLQILAANGNWGILIDALTLVNTLLTLIDEHSNVFEIIAASLTAFPIDALNAIKNTLMDMADALEKIDARKELQLDIKADGLDSILTKLKQIAEILGKLTGQNFGLDDEGGNDNEGANTSSNSVPSTPASSGEGAVPENVGQVGAERVSITGADVVGEANGGTVNAENVDTEEADMPPLEAEVETKVSTDSLKNVASEIEAVQTGSAKDIELNVKTNGLEEAASQVNQIEDKDANITVGVSADTGAISQAASAVNSFPEQNKTSTITVVQEFIKRYITERITRSGNKATGNVALAKGMAGPAKAGGTQKTLMGELGPELVVSNGSYHLVGENGPEMVDLANDAIVFNHLQTERLLKNGQAPGRGRAVTNEHNAIALAAGNTGPAMASASAALAALRQLRAMWESLRNASVSDLAGGGGGGGGGGGTQNNVVDPKAWVDTVERWYNLTQEIAKLEEEITHQETIRTKLQSDWQKNGNAYYRSQKESLKALNAQIAAQEQLNISRREYFDKRVEALKHEALGQIYTFDKDGQLQFRDDVTINGKQGGMEFLTDLYGFNSLGKANYTNKEKYEILMASGFADYMKYDSNGMEIKVGGEGTEEDYETFYEQATQAFRDRLDQYNDATQSLLDEINEGEDQIEQLETDRNEILKEIRDNQMELENSILDAIVESRQRQIDNLSDQRNALEDSTGEFIQGLSDALDKEREMYERQEAADELDRNKRRLAILQRSGGSAADISSLQNEISQQERDQYFESQQAQIDAIQEASDLELERLDKQIELMTETLEFEQEYGLLWGQVYTIMGGSAQEIRDFIHGNSADFWTQSALAQEQAINETIFKVEYWKSYDEDLDTIATETREQQLARDYATFDERMKKEYGENYDASGRYRAAFEEKYRQSWNIDEATDVARQLYHDEVIKPQEEARLQAEEQARLQAQAAAQQQQQASSGGGGGGNDCGGTCSGVCKDGCGGRCGATCQQKCKGNTKSSSLASQSQREAARVTGQDRMFGKGGLVTKPTRAIIGETGETEAVLNPRQTKILRENILSNHPNSLISLLKTYNEGFNQNNLAKAASQLYTEATDTGITIENATVNMNVQQISNDYDARRAGEQALNEIMRIARKSGATNSVRR